MCTVMIGLKELENFSTFSEAFKLFLSKVKEQVKQQGATWQVLETTNFIFLTTADGKKFAMDFYRVRDFAYENGLMNNGEFQEREELPVEVVRRAFEKSMTDACYASLLADIGTCLFGVN